MELYTQTYGHYAKLRENGVCKIGRINFDGPIDFFKYVLSGGSKNVRVAMGRIDLEKVTLEIDEKKRKVVISGEVNHSICGFL